MVTVLLNLFIFLFNCQQKNASFYSIIRLLLPKLDRERDSYGIKTATMGKLYVKILGINPKGDVGKKLTLHDTGERKHSDYSEIVYEVLKGRANDAGDITIYEVNQHLDRIASFYQNNNRPSNCFIYC